MFFRHDCCRPRLTIRGGVADPRMVSNCKAQSVLSECAVREEEEKQAADIGFWVLERSNLGEQ